jgi:chromosome segregation ATPase
MSRRASRSRSQASITGSVMTSTHPVDTSTRSVDGSYQDRLARKDAIIYELRERNRALEQAMSKHTQQMDDMKKANRKLSRRTREQSYMGSMLRHESAERATQLQKLQSLENVVDWSDVGRRHTVEQTLNDKTEEIEALRADLAGCELKLRLERSRGNKLQARVDMLEAIKADTAEQVEREKESIRTELEKHLEVADRNAAMVSRQNDQYDEMLRRMGRDLVASRTERENLQRKLGDANVMMVLQKMVALRRAETLRKLKDQLFEQNRLVVEKGGTAVDTDYLEREIGFGFNHKLNQLDEARTAAIDARDDLEKRRAEFEEMQQAKDAAESRSRELEQLATSAQLQVEQLSRDTDALREQLHQAQRYARSGSPTSSTAEGDLLGFPSSSRADNSPGVGGHTDSN